MKIIFNKKIMKYIFQYLIIFLNISIFTTGTWHAYDMNKKIPPNCFRNESNNNNNNLSHNLKIENIKKWKLWPGLINSYDQIHGETMDGFEEGIKAIYNNQHPDDCSKAKFMISNGWNQGFGSEIHVIGVGLALAMNMNRVFLMNPEGRPVNEDRDNRWQVNNSFCRNQNKTTLECYFEPWSSCNINDAMQKTTIEKLKSDKENTFFSDTDIVIKNIGDIPAKTILIEHRADINNVMPFSLRNVFKCTQIRHYRYWWRAVSASYFLRPNELTINLMNTYRSSDTLNFNSEKERCISIYIRKGDKNLEMQLINNNKYFETAKLIWDNNYIAEPHIGNGIIFIGSEDPIALNEAKQWGIDNKWKILYTNLFDRSFVSAGYNWTVQHHLRQTYQDKYDELEYFSMILNLDYHLKCSAFVCTLPSNFCRIIDELRATIGNKINASYADLNKNCVPPCISGIKDIYWRS
jgi:hypothetical protein